MCMADKGNILVVEDNPDNMKLVTWMLEDEGYIVTSAFNAEDGLQLATSNTYDAILMDISLPGMDGKEATKKLRATEKYRSATIFALTAHAIINETKEILDSGVDELITKPINETQLLERLKHYIQS
ncbi:response regulator [Gammaproteobacteria bacterium 42_54_T18]|nr:response regulator [Gammaproteobacteria bacterium 42_54_T18]